MANELIISVSGLRGIVGDTLTPDVAFRYASAFVATLPNGPVAVTCDGRANGPELLPPVIEGLSQRGTRRVLDGGIAATPTTGVLVRHHRCVGGVQISASHNPAPYNGLKLFSSDGRVVPGKDGEVVLQNYRSSSAATSGADYQHSAEKPDRLTDTATVHLNLIENIVDVERIRKRRFRVLLDANHGSGSVLGKPLLERLGCDVIIKGAIADGHFEHEP